MKNCPVQIDSDTCRACLRCVEECPVGAIHCGPKAVLDPDLCIACGHCAVACPHAAVHSALGDTIPWSPPAVSAVSVRELLTGRRSVRHYHPGELDRTLLKEVLSIGSYSPTASNARDVEAIVLEGESVRTVATAVNDYYARLVRWLENPWLRALLWLTPARPYLKQPKLLAHMRDCIRAFGPGRDWIFFDAPAVVILTAPRRNRRFGQVNATIAAEQLQIYATSLGLGSCWVGYAEVVLKASRAAAELAGVTAGREPQAVFTLGRPAVCFPRLPPRAPFPVVWRGARGEGTYGERAEQRRSASR